MKIARKRPGAERRRAPALSPAHAEPQATTRQPESRMLATITAGDPMPRGANSAATAQTHAVARPSDTRVAAADVAMPRILRRCVPARRASEASIVARSMTSTPFACQWLHASRERHAAQACPGASLTALRVPQRAHTVLGVGRGDVLVITTRARRR